MTTVTVPSQLVTWVFLLVVCLASFADTVITPEILGMFRILVSAHSKFTYFFYRKQKRVLFLDSQNDKLGQIVAK